MQVWNRLTYRGRMIVYGAGFIILSILCYNRKVVPTLELKNELDSLSHVAGSETIEEEINLLQSKLRYIDKLIGKDKKNLEAINQEILSFVSSCSDTLDVELVYMPRAHEYSEQGYTIYTHVITVKGGYHDLLRLAYYSENKTSGMKLASVRYFSKPDPRTRKLELFAELYIQSYEKNA